MSNHSLSGGSAKPIPAPPHNRAKRPVDPEGKMPAVSSVFMGNESLLVQCAESWLSRGGTIAKVITRNGDIKKWAADKGIPTLTPDTDIASGLADTPYDWLFSVANLDLIPDPVLATAKRGAINFHDGPLPRYAGLNAPVWALLAGETEFGITWHTITPGIDKGDIITQEMFAIAQGDTALTLNTKCYEAAIRGFGRVIDGIMADKLPLTAQDMTARSYFSRDKRPAAAARLDFTLPAETLAAMVRALDHGTYWNPLSLAKIEAAGRVYMVTEAVVEQGHDAAAPGTVLDIRADQIVVATGEDALVLKAMRHSDGRPVEVVTFAQVGDVLPSPDTGDIAALNDLGQKLAPADSFWRARLADMQPARLALADDKPSGEILSQQIPVPEGLSGDTLLAALAGFASRLAESDSCTLAFQSPDIAALTPAGYANTWVPLTLKAG
ncbi:MAG TPA: peptide synthetase, partial [Aliiroseovarius sp.]|nr:peptide synthetase [Aliiroseovarius sp.]